jgi:hypothetical protein
MVPATPAPATTVSGASVTTAGATYRWRRIAENPGHTPELLALAAVEAIGPRAADWARQIRDSYPKAGPAGIARLAAAEFARRGTLGGALAAAAGSYAPVALLGAAAWTQAELVLHVAAAYGLDPADPARAVDLLTLTRAHPSRADAEAALAGAKQPSTEVRSDVTATVRRLGRPIAAQLGGWLAVRAANRIFPGTSALVATLTSRAAAENLAVRATAYYRAAAR